jgi:hypothetical protein
MVPLPVQPDSTLAGEGQTDGVPIRVEKRWRILPVGEVHDQPAA